MSTLAVIPARGGSKGIPRKNLRLLKGAPLIQYAIVNALRCTLIDVVAVSTDSEEIAAFARQFKKVHVVERDSELAKDATTLDPVIFDAVMQMEKRLSCKFDTVVTMQPTSPLLKCSTLTEALGFFSNSNHDSLISVVNEPHLSWTKNKEGIFVPEYEKRLNRQQLPPRYMETGAFLVSNRKIITQNSRLGCSIGVFETPAEESVDIDTREDWAVCDALLSRKRIAFRVDGYPALGMGHIYRALTLAYALVNHDIFFICNSAYKEGMQKLKSANMKVIAIENDDDLMKWLSANKVDVFINDCLDTSVDYVKAVKKYVERFVSFEDLGEGAHVADAVVNEIYETGLQYPHVYTGKRYVCLRDEFLTTHPSEYRDSVGNILVMFGGTDPLNLTQRVYEVAQQYNAANVEKKRFDFIIGSGYQHEAPLDSPENNIFVARDIMRVSDYMRNADIAISSQGRTTFELASMGVPSIVLAQNRREQLHTFAQMDNGFINLGLGSEVSDEDILSTLNWLIESRSIRKEMHDLMQKSDLSSGINRVVRIILGESE